MLMVNGLMNRQTRPCEVRQQQHIYLYLLMKTQTCPKSFDTCDAASRLIGIGFCSFKLVWHGYTNILQYIHVGKLYAFNLFGLFTHHVWFVLCIVLYFR